MTSENVVALPFDAALTEPGAHLHTMSGSFTHPDGRCCGWHARLSQFLVLSDPAFVLYDKPYTWKCLRSHEGPSVTTAVAGLA